MVVVAIIGILAAVGIPQYQRFQSRARQSEAKVYLTSAFTALQAFAAESTTFTACLQQVGVTVAGDRRYYSTGISLAAGGGANCGPLGNTACNTYRWQNDGTVAPGTSTCVLAAGTAAAPSPNTPITANAFVAAGANIANINTFSAVPAALQAPAVAMAKAVFTLGAQGNVSANPNVAANVDDVWTIDQTKALNNVVDGI